MTLFRVSLLGLVLLLASCGMEPSQDSVQVSAPIAESAGVVGQVPEAVDAETAGSTVDVVAETPDPLTIFQQRILPIFESPDPSSCTECHLSGVELKDYIQPDQAATFAALRDRGLIDVENPDQSKILAFIERRPEGGGSLIPDSVRLNELAAFRAWIHAAVKDDTLLEAADRAEAFGPALPVEVIRHARADRVLTSFIENVWSEVRRCAACHSPDQNEQQVAKHGEYISWIALQDPQQTLQNLVDNGLIDTDDPDASLILAKPTLQVEHGGGQKMLIGDRTYRQFLTFVEDYAATLNGTYALADELPQPSTEVSAASDIWLKLTDVPEQFDQKFLRADVYHWNGEGWSTAPWASGDRAIYGKGQLWQQHLTIIASRGSERSAELLRNPQLPAGRYLVRIYIDQADRLAKDPTLELGETDFAGEIEIDSEWPVGYGSMTQVSFLSLRANTNAGTGQSR